MPGLQSLGPGRCGSLPELRGPLRRKPGDRDGADGEDPRTAGGRGDRADAGSSDAVVRGAHGQREAGPVSPPKPDRPTSPDPAGIGTPDPDGRPKAPLPRTPQVGERG